MVRSLYFNVVILLLFTGACASLKSNKLKAYREAFANNDFKTAKRLLAKTGLKKDKKSQLLWELEKGTVASSLKDFDGAIKHFQTAVDLIDSLYTTQLSSKAASFLVNDASDVFYGASYERSYAFYYLSKSYYSRYLQKGNPADLQGARSAILGWDTYFTELQRSASYKTLYHTDLMLKVFGGQVHEVSEVKNDKQIALQLYKDALKILDIEGGLFSLFNKSHLEYVKLYEENLTGGKGPPTKFFDKTLAYEDLREFIVYKILSLTKEIRGGDYASQVKSLKALPQTIKKVEGAEANIVLIIEEGLIPQKVGKPFNFGIKGAMNSTDSSAAKQLIASVGVEFVTAFAMNELGLVPSQTAGPGNFIFAHSMTRLAVQEAAVEFELPMIENVSPIQRLELFVLNEKGAVVKHMPLPVVSETGDIARIVLEEDVVARYSKTGTRVALKHLSAIAAAIGVYQGFKVSDKKGESGGNFLAKAAAMGTYVASSKGISALEKADVRYWSTLPQALRMTELHLAPGTYQIGVGSYSGAEPPLASAKVLGSIVVKGTGKAIHTLTFHSL